MRHLSRLLSFGALVFICANSLQAQGVQSAELSGVTKSSDGALLPGVTVTARSTALLGVRSVVTDSYGAYIMKGLPAGEYTVTFELPGMTTVKKPSHLAVGQSTNVDASLSISKVEESVTVTAEASSIVNTTEGTSHFSAKEIDTLPTDREIDAVATLAPGVSVSGANQTLTISGGVPYDNVFLLDGVDVADNVFGSPENDLYIDDALEETQVLTSGVSAEFGRFAGGVVNAVTKKGGNKFSGSFRTDLSNPSWVSNTPIETQQGTVHKSQLGESFQGTLGGPIVTDRLWFFLAGLKQSTSTPDVFPETGGAFDELFDQKRFEGKLTGSISPNHTVTVAYTKRYNTQTRTAFLPDLGLDPSTLITPSFPGDLFVVSYNGVLSPKLFVEARYSTKNACNCNFGGSDTNFLSGTPFITLGINVPSGLNYHAPYFDATDDSHRNNREAAASLSYFLSTPSFGKHDLKFGFENFRDTTIGGNSQSPTNFVYYADYVQTATGHPALDANGNVVPNWAPGQDLQLEWLASRGAELDLTTTSVYLNDKWRLDDHWGFNLGARYEWVRSDATGGPPPVSTTSFVPRLGASFDPKGDGRFKLDATYAIYAGRYNPVLFGNASEAGNPKLIYQVYVGPPGQGFNFAPAFDSSNYVVAAVNEPTVTNKFDPNLGAPLIKEFTAGAGANIRGDQGFAKVTYTWRKYTNFVQDFVTLAGGNSDVTIDGVNYGEFPTHVFQNTDLPDRHYQSVQLQVGYRLTDHWKLTGNYTLELTNDGNYEGEAPGQPALTSLVGQFPEVFPASRFYPDGHLANYQEHRVRAWTTYDLGLGKAGNVNMSLLWRLDSGRTDSYVANSQSLSSIQMQLGAGYSQLPAFQNIYFGQRGAVQFPGSSLFDFALTYDIPVYRSWKPYVKVDVRNVFNTLAVIGFDDVVSPDPSGPVDSFGLPLQYVKSPQFGQAISINDFAVPRTFQFALGFRF
jgi:hypothetical protein